MKQIFYNMHMEYLQKIAKATMSTIKFLAGYRSHKKVESHMLALAAVAACKHEAEGKDNLTIYDVDAFTEDMNQNAELLANEFGTGMMQWQRSYVRVLIDMYNNVRECIHSMNAGVQMDLVDDFLAFRSYASRPWHAKLKAALEIDVGN